MIRKSVFVSVVLAAVAGVALAASRQSMSFELKEKTSLGGTEISPGRYKLTWTGDTDVQVEVVKGGKVVAAGKGRLVERERKSTDDAVVSRRHGSGMVLSEVHFGGKKSVLVLSES